MGFTNSGSPSSEELEGSPTFTSLSFIPTQEEDAEPSLEGYPDLPPNLSPTFKIPTSKSPIIEALACCAVNGWGIEVVTNAQETEDAPASVVRKFVLILFSGRFRRSI
jgi:hypothetical protein